METALAMVKNPRTGVALRARIYLDRGSTDSFISDELAAQLRCEVADQQTVDMGTFGTNLTKEVDTGLVDFQIVSTLSSHTSFSVQLQTIKHICGDIPSNLLDKSEMEQLAPYPLADYPATQGLSLHVDILIGMDRVWDFMKKRVLKTGFGPCLLETELGWVLSGPLAGRPRGGAIMRPISALLINTNFVHPELQSGSDAGLNQVLHKFIARHVLPDMR